MAVLSLSAYEEQQRAAVRPFFYAVRERETYYEKLRDGAPGLSIAFALTWLGYWLTTTARVVVQDSLNSALCGDATLTCPASRASRVVVFVGVVVLGAELSDFFSGLVHILLDFKVLQVKDQSEKSPLEWACWGFQFHHLKPNNWNDCDIIVYGVCRSGLFAMGIMSLLLWTSLLLQPGTASTPGALLHLSLYAGSILALLPQVAHAAAHGKWRVRPQRDPLSGELLRDAEGRLVVRSSCDWMDSLTQLLQRWRLFVGVNEHKSHHEDYDKNFCILTGHCNPIVNALYAHWLSRYVDPSNSAEVQRELYSRERYKIRSPFCELSSEYRRRKRSEAATVAHS